MIYFDDFQKYDFLKYATKSVLITFCITSKFITVFHACSCWNIKIVRTGYLGMFAIWLHSKLHIFIFNT
jgi:hypothetical protein